MSLPHPLPSDLSDSDAHRRALVISADPAQPLHPDYVCLSDLSGWDDMPASATSGVTLQDPDATIWRNRLAYMHPDAHADSMNVRASAYAWLHRPDLRTMAYVLGEAVLLGPIQPDGQPSDVPAEILDLLLHTDTYQVQLSTRADPGRWLPCATTSPHWFAAHVWALKLRGWSSVVAEARVVPLIDGNVPAQCIRTGEKHLPAEKGHAFRAEGIEAHSDLISLADAIRTTPLTAGTAFRYRNLCLINLVDGRESWLLLTEDATFEISHLRPGIAEGTFAELITALAAMADESPTGRTSLLEPSQTAPHLTRSIRWGASHAGQQEPL